MLKDEFPDISISKIRYLEDQGLLAPRRTQGGYRLFSEDDLERLETILRLQRDEFLPLRVIRQELASSGARDRKKRRAGLTGEEHELDLDELCERAGIDARLARELEEFGLLAPRTESGAEALPRAGCGYRARLRPARPVRDRASAPAGVPHGSRPRGRAHRPGRRTGAARPQSRSGAGPGWRIWRRSASLPRASASCSSGAPCGGLRQHDPVNLAEKVREVPTGPSRASVSRTSRRCSRIPRHSRIRSSSWRSGGRRRQPDLIVGAEARGFILGAAIAKEIGCGFVPARRPGKLPPETISATYALEYGQNALELHPDMVPRGARVLIHDDVLATGGTVEAIAGQLVERLGGIVVGCCFIIELGFLNGRERLSKYDLHALIEY